MAERINQHEYPIIETNNRRLRKEHSIKAAEVITKLQLEDINVNTGTFLRIENGRNNPTVQMLIALTKIFNCDYNEFFIH